MKTVIKLGGHLFPCKPTPEKISAYAETLKKLRELGHRLIVVTGGGRVARTYIDAARRLGASEFTCDLLGIEVSRLNARLFIANMSEDAYPEPVTSLSMLLRAFETNKIVFLGGLQPGQSTNAVGVLSAEAVNADLFINATDVDGVYTADPEVDPTAKKLEIVRTDELLKMLLAKKLLAGSYALFDPVAIKLVERSKIPTRIIDGRNPANIEAAAKGKDVGTLIVSAAQ
ncbi:UMP kinase [Candidatus Bathyarchaeota archaeon]|nr:MAG: UMP kinase [Candidatus Bathyarchaeota archaeon]